MSNCRPPLSGKHPLSANNQPFNAHDVFLATQKFKCTLPGRESVDVVHSEEEETSTCQAQRWSVQLKSCPEDFRFVPLDGENRPIDPNTGKLFKDWNEPEKH